MKMSRLKRISSRIAKLSENVLKKLSERYGLTMKILNKINDFTETHENSDLMTEWVAKGILHTAAIRPEEDFPRFSEAWSFYWRHRNDPRFKIFSQERGKNFKNPLEFTLHDMEEAEDEIQKPQVDPRVYQLSNKLPRGARKVYSDPQYQIVEVMTPEAACELSRGTKWCTSNKEDAEYYIDSGPLLVVYERGKKILQFHEDSAQLANLRDRNQGLSQYPGLFKVLQKVGVFDKKAGFEKLNWAIRAQEPWEHAEKEALKNWLDGYFINEYALNVLGGKRWKAAERKLLTQHNILYAISYAADVMKRRWKPLEKLILKKGDSREAYDYAQKVINGRWVEGEHLIAEDYQYSYYYAENVLHGRFPEGEQAIRENPRLWEIYKNKFGIKTTD